MSKPYVSVLANYTITSAPSGITIAATNQQVSLGWTALYFANYNVERATSSGGPFNVSTRT